MRGNPTNIVSVYVSRLLNYIKNFRQKNSHHKLKVISGLAVMVLLVILITGIISTGKNSSRIQVKDNDSLRSLNFKLTNEMSNFNGSEKFDSKIIRFMRQNALHAASIAIMKDDKLIYAKGYGLTHNNDSSECTVKNIFRIASASKLITAVGIMKLQEDGKLTLNDKVFGKDGILNDSIYLNYKDKKIEQITIDDLLRHRGGFRCPHGDAMFNNNLVARYLGKELPLSTQDYVVYATKVGVKWTPGASSDYSNLGYLVLSAVIEKVTHTKYEKFIKSEILEPLGIYDMHIAENTPDKYRPNEVYYFDCEKDCEKVPAFDGSDTLVEKANGGNDVKALLGAGGWVTSPVELLRLVASVNNCTHKKNILSSASISKMTEPIKNYIPIGWAKVTRKEWYRSGNMCGTSTLVKKEADGFTWVFITNTSSWRGPKFYRDISANIKKAINSVKAWPADRDLFLNL